MRDPFIMLAALDPAGPLAAAFGISWTLLLLVSGATALASLGFCFFQRMAQRAFRLSCVGIWTGSIAVVVVIVVTVATAGFPTEPPESIADAVFTILLTGIAPVVAFFTGRISRRKMIMGKANVAG